MINKLLAFAIFDNLVNNPPASKSIVAKKQKVPNTT